MQIQGLDVKSLKKTFNRLKKDTKNFTTFHVRDATDFIDFSYSLDVNLKYLINTIKNESYSPSKPRFHLSPKSKGINRPTVVPALQDCIVYRYCVEQIEDELLSKTRQKHIRGGLKITANKNHLEGDDFYEKWFDDWKAHNDNLKEGLFKKKFLVYTDIASYFENINITLLRDLVRSDVSGKKELLNLLFYFLEATVSRKEYESNTFTGLLQEDFNASRVLAFYFLKTHDDAMAEFCKNTSAEYFRFVDDMSVLVNSETEGRKALKAMTESLRRLNLVAGIEKTSIISAKQAKYELFLSTNTKISKFENQLIKNLQNRDSVLDVKNEIRSYYHKLLKAEKDKYKNWIKILKRFYSVCSYGAFNIFEQDFENHLIKYPLIFSDIRIKKFILSQKNAELNKIVKTFIDYLYSEENLYQQLESNIIETLLAIPVARINDDNKNNLVSLAIDIIKFPKKYQVQSEYAKALASLLSFKFSKNIDVIANIYLKGQIEDEVLRKYIILVSLTTSKHQLREKILAKARRDPNPTIQYLIHLIDDAENALESIPLKDYLKTSQVFIFYDPESKFQITKPIDNVRARLLKKVLETYG